MADKTSVTSKISFVANFNDGDTRTITMPDPKPAEQLPSLLGGLQQSWLASHAVVGDKNEGVFTHLSDAKVIQITETKFDIGF